MKTKRALVRRWTSVMKDRYSKSCRECTRVHSQTAVMNEAGEMECVLNEDLWKQKTYETLERYFDEEM